MRYFDGHVCFYRFLGPLDTKSRKNVRKISKNKFSGNFHGWIWPFPDLKPDPSGQKGTLCAPGEVGKFISTGFWGH